MIYEVTLTVPANTAQSAPASQEFFLHPGTVELVNIQLPPGCAGLVHAIIKANEHQIWPSQLDQNFHGDDLNVSFPEHMELGNSQNRFQLVAWSDDDTYEHEAIARLAVVEIGGTLQEAIALIGAPTERLITTEGS